MNCDAIHQTNTTSLVNMEQAAQGVRQEATISAAAAAAAANAGEEVTVTTDDLKKVTRTGSSSSDDEDELPGDVPQKMGLVRFMELNNNNNNNINTTKARTRSNDSDSDDSDDSDDEEESIDIFNTESVVLSPVIQKYTLNKNASDDMLKNIGSGLDTTEHTVTESSSFSDDPLEPEPLSLLSSWHCIRSTAAAEYAAASAAVLKATILGSQLPPLHVASDDRVRVQPDDDQDDEADTEDYHRHQVQLQDLKRHCVLGEGFLGKVWLVSDTSSRPQQKEQDNNHHHLYHHDNCYALKRLSKCDLMNEDLIDSVIRERDVLREMFHPGIVKLVASYQDERYVYLLQDYCPGGELFSLMASRQEQEGAEAGAGAFSEDACRFYTSCLTDALWYMHVRKLVVYRDLKPENVMLDSLGYPILVDFGHARKLLSNNNNNQDEQDHDEPAKAYTLCGTPKFVAPEMIQGTGHSFAVDYWSLGIILYQMLTNNQHPFQYDDDMDDFSLYETIVQDEYMPLNADTVSPEAADLVHGLLQKDPQQRIGAVDESATHNAILEHAFFSGKINVGLLRRRLIPAPWVPKLKDSLDASHFDDFEHIQSNSDSGGNNSHHLGMSSLHLSLRDQEKFANF